MKSLKYFFAAVSFMFICSISQAQRIAVVDFNAGAGISQADVEGMSAIFNTYFSPKGYTLVERTQIDRVIDEQGFQRGRFTQKQMVRIGEILNVAKVVVGDISIVMGEYNVDVRVINVQSGTIAAKDGMAWDKNTSYREMMKQLAERLADQIAILPVEREPEKPVKIQSPLHRETGGYLSIATGIPMYGSISYKHYITPSFSLGGGVGIADIGYKQDNWHWSYSDKIWTHEGSFYGGSNTCIPIFAEIELRTPRNDWSVFVNIKLGVNIYTGKREDQYYGYYYNGHYSEYVDYSYKWFYASMAIGASYKNLNLGIGLGDYSYYSRIEEHLSIFLSYDIPIKGIKEALF